MAYEKLSHNRYFDPSDPSAVVDHDSRDHHQDLDDFHLPLARMHQAHLHDPGIAAGLEVSGTLGATSLTIQPGVASDAQGHLLSLSPQGTADIGANPSGNLSREV